MRINRDKDQSKSKLQEQQDNVMKSMDETKIINDKLKEDNLSLLSSIKSNESKKYKLDKENLDLLKEIDKTTKLSEKKDKELWERRESLLDLENKIKSNEKLLDKQIKDNSKKHNDLMLGFLKDKEKLINKIELEQNKLNSLDSKRGLVRKEIDILQKQKSSLYDSITADNNKLNNIKRQINIKIKEYKNTEENNEKLGHINVNLISEIESLEKEKGITIKSQKLESDKLANINKEVKKQDDALYKIKEQSVSIVKEREKMQWLKAKITDLYEKAGITINL